MDMGDAWPNCLCTLSLRASSACASQSACWWFVCSACGCWSWMPDSALRVTLSPNFVCGCWLCARCVLFFLVLPGLVPGAAAFRVSLTLTELYSHLFGSASTVIVASVHSCYSASLEESQTIIRECQHSDRCCICDLRIENLH